MEHLPTLLLRLVLLPTKFASLLADLRHVSTLTSLGLINSGLQSQLILLKLIEAGL